MREDKRGKKGGGDGAPFIGDTAGSGGRPTGSATWWRGVGEGHGAGMAVGRRGVAGSGPAAVLAGGARVKGVRPVSKQGRGDADERALVQ
jgi:hypothetical protein